MKLLTQPQPANPKRRMTGAIDKLEVRIPREKEFHPEFAKLYCDIAADNRVFREGKHYVRVGDLRPFGYDAVLHLLCKHGKEGNHKVELIDTGRQRLHRMVNEVERIFQTDARRADVTRIDLAVDVQGTGVDYFRSSFRVVWKRRAAELGEYMTVTQGEGETLYFGKRPNCFRVYNKRAELKEQYKRHLKGVSPDAEFPSFEQVCGIPESGPALTRVERQIGGGRIPEQIANVSRLKNLPTYNPFEPVRILAPGAAEPNYAALNFSQKYCAKWWRERIVSGELSYHRALQLIRIDQGNSAKRVLEWLEPFIAAPIGEQRYISADDLFERYQDSVTRQVAA